MGLFVSGKKWKKKRDRGTCAFVLRVQALQIIIIKVSFSTLFTRDSVIHFVRLTRALHLYLHSSCAREAGTRIVSPNNNDGTHSRFEFSLHYRADKKRCVLFAAAFERSISILLSSLLIRIIIWDRIYQKILGLVIKIVTIQFLFQLIRQFVHLLSVFPSTITH